MELKKKLFLPIVIFFYLGLVYSQNTKFVDGRILSNAQLVEDYNILYSSLINYHPAPFLYISESNLKNFYDKQKASFPDSLSEREFYVIARQLITQIKCGHTYGNISDYWNNAITGKSVLIPFEVQNIGGKIFIKTTDEEAFPFKIGDQVLSINNVPIEIIMKRMDSIQVRDGISQSFVKEVTAIKFRMYYLYLYGNQDEYLIEYISTAGEKEQAIVKSLTDKLTRGTNKVSLPDNFKILYSNNWSLFAVDSISNLAYVKIVSFSDRKEYKKYYKQIFSHLREFPSAQLLIDIRDNTGGYFGNGNNFLTYLTPNKFEYNFQRPKGKIEKNKYTKLGFWSKLTKLAFSIKPTKHRVPGKNTYTFSYKPDKLLYTGNLHVMTNGITFSQAALVSAQLKESGAVFYGTETGGTENSTNAMLNHKVILPHSEFEASIPYYQVISNSTKGEFGYGIKPDFELLPSSGSNDDKVLMEVLSLLSVHEKP